MMAPTFSKNVFSHSSNSAVPSSAPNIWLAETAAPFMAHFPSRKNITSPPSIGDSSPAKRKPIFHGIPGSIHTRIASLRFGFTKSSGVMASPTNKTKPISSAPSFAALRQGIDPAYRQLPETYSEKSSAGKFWFRDVDSNHDTQLQRLMSYRLDDPGTAANSLPEEKECAKRRKCARRQSFC